MNEMNEIFDKLFNFFGVSTITDLSKKLEMSQPAVTNWKSRNSINAVKKKCRELGIYNEIFGDLNTNVNNLQHSKFTGNATGVDNSNNKNIGFDKKDELECDDFTKSLIKQLCVVYKDEQTKLQNEIMKLIQNV